MPKYRLYVYDAEDRLIAPAMVIAADNDKAAIEQSENMLDGVRVELRDGIAWLWNTTQAKSGGRRSAQRDKFCLASPILLGFTLHHRCVRILHLRPMRGTPGSIGRAKPLRDDAVTAEAAWARISLDTAILFLSQTIASPSIKQDRTGSLAVAK
jgi:hypothetical protein